LAKADLGEKQLCPSCGAKFYDLNKRPAVCPKCQTAFDPADESLRLKRARTRAPVYEDETPEDEEAEVVERDDSVEEEVEDTPEIDEAADEPILVDDEEGEDAAPEGELPPGFSEDAEIADDEEVADDEGVPLLEDDEEFEEEELGEISEDDDAER
jgi:uncharacterized protein (TIGR02300 family)